jgi:hypothetical protein
MLFIFRSSSLFSALTAASGPPPAPVPVVKPDDVFAPDDWAVPRLLVPRGGAGEFATPPVDPTAPPADPAEPPVACANETAGIAARLRITINALPEMVADDLAIGNSPSPINRRSDEGFRNKSCQTSLNMTAATMRS